MIVESVYSRLFRYRAKTDREPLEDFLTEALADILGRMPTDRIYELIDHAFHDGLDDQFLRAAASNPLTWRTQVPANGKIADLVMYSGARPTLIFENKTWSAYQDHSIDDEVANQLTTYCAWLAKANANDTPCAVVLLTGTTSYPAGYHDEGGAYAVKRRGQMTWAQLGRWFDAVRSDFDEGDKPVWLELASDFVAFLKEKNLTSEIITNSDAAALQLFIPTMDRWGATLATVWDGSQPIWEKFLKTRVSSPVFDTEGGSLWQWRYAKGDLPARMTWIGLGVRFPDQSNWYEGVLLPDQPHLFVSIGNDGHDLILNGKLPKDWVASEDEWLLALPLHELPRSVDDRLQHLRKWGDRAMRDAQQILAILSSTDTNA